MTWGQEDEQCQVGSWGLGVRSQKTSGTLTLYRSESDAYAQTSYSVRPSLLLCEKGQAQDLPPQM